MKEFIDNIPKAELHIHLEGSIEPKMLLTLAEKNKIRLRYNTIEEVEKAYHFKDLKDFLYIYTQGTKVLRKAEDFYDITKAYLSKVYSQSVLHAEIFIDFQTYSRRGIRSEIIMDGITSAIKDAKRDYGASAYLILAFLRHLGVREALKTLIEGVKYRDDLIGIGLASTELGYPPEMFEKVFEEARKYGFKTMAHAGEEGPAEYVRNSIEVLKVDRVDHGNRAMEDSDLVKMIVDRQIPLTICPLSNIALGNVKRLEEHTLKKKLDMGMLVSVNSDDPAYFGGYVNENMISVTKALNLTKADIVKLANNSFVSSFLPEDKKKYYLEMIKRYSE